MKYVYILRVGENHYKVGVASSVKKRVETLRTANPIPIEIVTTMLVDDAYKLEGKIHGSLSDMKTEGGREWFKLTPQQVLDLCIQLHQEPEYDLKPVARLRDILAIHEDNQRRIERKLNRVIALANARLQEKKPRPLQPLPIPEIEKEPLTKRNKINDEDLLQMAKDICKSEGKASTSLLQRKLRIGYGRAARMIEDLESTGFIGSADGIRPRRILMD